MLMCGLSADTETLERIVSTFTGTHPVERAANGLLRAVLMLDASAPMLDPLTVPGMLQLAPCAAPVWRTRTSLMHAKVAVFGFADERYASPTTFRLIVSTGNWTRETWGNGAQIDMFWSTDCYIGADGDTDVTALADVVAALNFFDRLMSGLYPNSSGFLATQPLAMGWLADWRATLGRPPRNSTPRFVHSLDKSLFTQIQQRFPAAGVSKLVAGSGFWEQAEGNTQDKPDVLKRLDELDVRGPRYLVANPTQAGALAAWFAAHPKAARTGQIGGWTLCAPVDPLQQGASIGRTFLHAKYIAGLARVTSDSPHKGTLTFLYLGSGNLSRAGLLSKAALDRAASARSPAGNVEAGVTFTGKEEVTRVWHVLACGDVLPAKAIATMEPGAVEPILVPRDPPPVLFAYVKDGLLHLVRSDNAVAALEMRLDAIGAWLAIDASDEGVAITGKVPPLLWVRVRTADTGTGPQVYEVPVFGEDGACCRQYASELGINDALEALLAFPNPPPETPDPDPRQPGQPVTPAASGACRYPLKVLAALIEAIGQRNSIIREAQFPAWLSQLRYLLLEQVAPTDREAIRRAGINLFPALLQPGFAPPWLHAHPHLEVAYNNLMRELECAWTIPAAICAAQGEGNE